MSIAPVTTPTRCAPAIAAPSAASTQTSATRPGLVLPALEIPTRESLARDTASFAEDVGKMFRAAGIRVPPNPVLTNDAQGYVRVAGDHPDKDTIEQLFKDNPELQQRYAKISAGSSLLRAAEHFSQYASAYDQLADDPAAQAALVDAEVARNAAPFFLAITAGGAEPFFGVSGATA